MTRDALEEDIDEGGSDGPRHGFRHAGFCVQSLGSALRLLPHSSFTSCRVSQFVGFGTHRGASRRPGALKISAEWVRSSYNLLVAITRTPSMSLAFE